MRHSVIFCVILAGFMEYGLVHGSGTNSFQVTILTSNQSNPNASIQSTESGNLSTPSTTLAPTSVFTLGSTSSDTSSTINASGLVTSTGKSSSQVTTLTSNQSNLNASTQSTKSGNLSTPSTTLAPTSVSTLGSISSDTSSTINASGVVRTSETTASNVLASSVSAITASPVSSAAAKGNLSNDVSVTGLQSTTTELANFSLPAFTESSTSDQPSTVNVSRTGALASASSQAASKETSISTTTSPEVTSQDVDECANGEDPCNVTTSNCVNKPGGYWCDCNAGYAQGSSDKLCIDVDECASPRLNNCSKYEQCQNTLGSYTCECIGRDVYKDDTGACARSKIERMKTKLEREFTSDLMNTSSDKYKELARQIEYNATEDLKRENQSDIYLVKVVKLEKGSVIATLVVLMNSSAALRLPAGYNISKAADSDYCILNQCDKNSTVCHGSADLKDYWCSCKDDTYGPLTAYSCRQKDECSDVKQCPTVRDHCTFQNGVHRCVSEAKKSCNASFTRRCKPGTCILLANGETQCRCPDGLTGSTCNKKTVNESEVNNLRNILIGVGVGLGSLALFCAIALCIVCCSDKRKSSKSVALTASHYAADDVTIDTWEPSLPRPKIKPGAFSHSSLVGLEMNERRHREQGAGAENPAYIPDADYDSGNKEGRPAANGKKKGSSDYVYF
ncbi:protein HEG homolog 1-like [Watersipora subatra]|uniref:protein HEG homolog 1-like n=1 Tax=Watersipora subatra TaxID=2589382 RepID=UPI00355C628A